MKKTSIALLLIGPLLFSACSSVPADEFHAVSAERDYYKIKYEQAIRDLETAKRKLDTQEIENPVPDELPAASAASPAVEEDLTNENSTEILPVTEPVTQEAAAEQAPPAEEAPPETENTVSGSKANFPEDQSTLDGTIVTSDYVLIITDYKVIQPGEPGNPQGEGPVIAFWYDTTSTSDNEISPTAAWGSAIKLTQSPDAETNYELDMTTIPDEKFLDTQMQVIAKGDTLSGAVAYRLADEKAPVVLTARDSLVGKELGRQVFPLEKPTDDDFVDGSG
ncbi:MAG: DUF5067 domain-containing protein [Lachnospiraceae bacterium]|nr:DUF5067 domain-containing protein [Lachnospiraceae bacterium]